MTWHAWSHFFTAVTWSTCCGERKAEILCQITNCIAVSGLYWLHFQANSFSAKRLASIEPGNMQLIFWTRPKNTKKVDFDSVYPWFANLMSGRGDVIKFIF